MKKSKVQSIGSRKKKPLGKSRGGGARTPNEAAGKTTIPDWAKLEVPVDFVEARKNIAKLVRMSVNEIAGQFIQLAKEGEVAPAKYLFEVVGLYPVREETSSKPEHSLAYTLLKQLGLPTELETDEESSSSVPSFPSPGVAKPGM
jgi:hypothetical protein